MVQHACLNYRPMHFGKTPLSTFGEMSESILVICTNNYKELTSNKAFCMQRGMQYKFSAWLFKYGYGFAGKRLATMLSVVRQRLPSCSSNQKVS